MVKGKSSDTYAYPWTRILIGKKHLITHYLYFNTVFLIIQGRN